MKRAIFSRTSGHLQRRRKRVGRSAGHDSRVGNGSSPSHSIRTTSNLNAWMRDLDCFVCQRSDISKAYEKVVNQRTDFLHKISRYYVDNYDLIVTEKLMVKNKIRCHSLSRSISDASWGTLNQFISYKAENAGKRFVQCAPSYSSINCSNCGHRVYKPLKERLHSCPTCGISISRDYNASRNILMKGLEKVGSGRPELTLADIRPLHQLELMQAGWRKQEGPNREEIELCKSTPGALNILPRSLIPRASGS